MARGSICLTPPDPSARERRFSVAFFFRHFLDNLFIFSASLFPVSSNFWLVLLRESEPDDAANGNRTLKAFLVLSTGSIDCAESGRVMKGDSNWLDFWVSTDIDGDVKIGY